MTLDSVRIISVVKVWLALVFLNSLLVLQNRWPTVGVRWVAEFSVEFAMVLLGLTLSTQWSGVQHRALHRLLVGAYLLLTLGRYLDVTVPALMGRPLNLYWDIEHAVRVAAMFVDSVPGWQLGFMVVGLLGLLALLVLSLHWAFGSILGELVQPGGRRWLGAVSLGLLLLYGVGRVSVWIPTERWFALPVSGMFMEQVRLMSSALQRDRNGLRTQAPLPDSDLQRLEHGDVWVLFFESYGALVFDDARFAVPLASEFADLQYTSSAAGWRSASARVESSTFGGVSWLAHSSVLSGLRIADQADYQDLLVSERATLVQRFAAVGYRTVAVVPGLKMPWPEGAFYHFDQIYNPERLRYEGPAYGWWAIPDQYSLYRVHRLEMQASQRQPRFIFFPTINSHAPFKPLPPYYPDWAYFDAVAAKSIPDLATVPLDHRIDGAALAAAYIDSIRYNLKVLGGYLSQYAPPNALIVVVGDHQPPAIVGGREISWQVPVHLFSRNPHLIHTFVKLGLKQGLIPSPRPLGGIEGLGPLLLRTLDSHAAGWEQ
jgi:hypothetical protein